jgi:IS30 family transposase
VQRKLRSIDVIHVLSEPGRIRSDNGPEFIAVREWNAAVGSKTAYVAPVSPWGNGYVESFNARFRDELLPFTHITQTISARTRQRYFDGRARGFGLGRPREHHRAACVTSR